MTTNLIEFEEEPLSGLPSTTPRRRTTALRIVKFPQARKKINERLSRLEWYYREHGRPPTWDELIAIRAHKEMNR